MKRIIGDPTREMTHARISPDKEWVVFTRYNKKRRGIALERNSQYKKTEIMIMRLDGTKVQTLVPPQKGMIAANGSWTPDGKGVIYVASEKGGKETTINYIDVATRRITPLRVTKDRWAGDPYQVKDWLIYNNIRPKLQLSTVWLMKSDGSDARQITAPAFSKAMKKRAKPPLGDYDPKLSPDASRVAVQRNVGKGVFHIVVADVKTGEEKDLSAPYLKPGATVADCLPGWSSDGRLIIFWHGDTEHLPNSGLYTILPDGSDRKRVPLPHGYFYKTPCFFPKEGSDKNTRIIFSALKNPKF